MSSKRKVKKERSLSGGIFIGTGVSLIISVVLSMIAAALIVNERVSENGIGYITPIISLIATMAGCIIAARFVGQKLAIISGATGIIYLIILIGIGIMFFDGGFHNMWTSILSIGVGCAVSCAICIRGKGSGKRRKRSYR